MELPERIEHYYDRLTKREKLVADYVRHHQREVLALTLSELADHAGVSETTVFRFCRSIKLEGYQAFKMALALCTNNKHMLDAGTNVNIALSANSHEVCEKVLNVYQSALQKAFGQLDYAAIDRTVDALLNARLISLFGFSGSGIAAALMQNKFAKILPNIICFSDSHMQLTNAALLKAGDVCFVFCNSGITIDAIHIAELAHAAGAFTIFATSLPTTPAAASCDVILPCGAPEGPMQGGSISVLASQLYMVDVLYAEAFRRLGPQAAVNKEKTAQAITHKML